MKQQQLRKSSALLAAGAGAAVCLTGGGAQAIGVSGDIFDSNGKTLFNISSVLKACSSQASWILETYPGNGILGFYFEAATGMLHNTDNLYVLPHNAGVTVSESMPGIFRDYLRIPNGLSDKYFAVRYNNLGGGVRYGWLHVISTTADTIALDKWGFENTGASIKTLADSVKTRKLGLADGREKLVWTNANEDGVARYEVQAKDASGAWRALRSEAPGAGMYSIAVPSGAQCRIVVENVDASAGNIGF